MNKWINIWTNSYIGWWINKVKKIASNNNFLKAEEFFPYNIVCGGYVGRKKQIYTMNILLVALTTKRWLGMS